MNKTEFRTFKTECVIMQNSALSRVFMITFESRELKAFTGNGMMQWLPSNPGPNPKIHCQLWRMRKYMNMANSMKAKLSKTLISKIEPTDLNTFKNQEIIGCWQEEEL